MSMVTSGNTAVVWIELYFEVYFSVIWLVLTLFVYKYKHNILSAPIPVLQRIDAKLNISLGNLCKIDYLFLKLLTNSLSLCTIFFKMKWFNYIVLYIRELMPWSQRRQMITNETKWNKNNRFLITFCDALIS